MKAIINEKEYELASFEILVRGEKGIEEMEKIRDIRNELHMSNNGECVYVKTEREPFHPLRREIRYRMQFEDACVAPNVEASEPPTRDVNRDSGTGCAHGGSLR